MKILIETYGCQMNIAESDSLSSLLVNHGHSMIELPEEADLIILNTCSVRLTAEDRIIGRIGYYRGLTQKSQRPYPVVLMGCMAQNIGEEIRKRFPDVVKLVWGTYNKQGIIRYLEHIQNEDSLTLEGFEFMPAEAQKRFPFKAFLSIAHGCDNYCSYCIVPYVRGHETHRKAEEILNDVRRLVEEGVLEISLLGQNVNSYHDSGIDFPDLLAQAADVKGLRRLTFLTSHPKDFSRKLADVIRDHPVIMKYLHLPAQSGNDRILGLMNRKYNSEEYFNKIEMVKDIPGMILSTDLLVGFPGESHDEFMDTINLVKTVRFHEAFMYRYNVRPGTKAAEMEDQVPEQEKLDRLNQLITIQNAISRKLLQQHVGEEHSVLLETVSKKSGNELTGRTHNGLMAFVKGTSDEIGTIVKVRLSALSGNGFRAERIDD